MTANAKPGAAARPGPKTTSGKPIAARNATRHGPFARCALAELDATEADCKHEPELAADVERVARTAVHAASLDQDFDLARLDNTHPAPASETNSQICENEPPAPTEPHDLDRDVSYVHPDGRPVYLSPELWIALQRMRDDGEHERADKHDAHYRSMHVFYQEGRRQRREAQSQTQEPDTPAVTSPP